MADNWGVQIRPITAPDGVLTGALVRGALRPASPHVPRAGAIAAENTHNAAGGKVMAVEVMAGIAGVARDAGLPLHLDGARLWNAAAALDVPVSRLAAGATTAMVSFSKGLGCPVGSCLAIPAGERPRAWKSANGWAAACGSRESSPPQRVGLGPHLARLPEDHANARLLAERLAACPAVRTDLRSRTW